MPTLTVTSRGQVTLRKETLQHLGLRPGDKIQLSLLPGGKGLITAATPAGNINQFVGLLAGQTTRVATLEELDETAAQAWAGQK